MANRDSKTESSDAARRQALRDAMEQCDRFAADADRLARGSSFADELKARAHGARLCRDRIADLLKVMP